MSISATAAPGANGGRNIFALLADIERRYEELEQQMADPEVATDPPRLTLLDSHDDWLLRQPADTRISLESAGDGSGRPRLRTRFAHHCR